MILLRTVYAETGWQVNTFEMKTSRMFLRAACERLHFFLLALQGLLELGYVSRTRRKKGVSISKP